jgi:hypothetical protein
MAGVDAAPVGTGGFVPTREYRAKWAFAIAAIFVFVALFLAGGGFGFGASPLGLLLGPILGAVIHAVAAAGLESRASGARYAMSPLLWILVVTGLISVAVALLRSTLLFPVGAILAWWSLRVPPDPNLGPVPLGSGVGTLLIAGSIISAFFFLLGIL